MKKIIIILGSIAIILALIALKGIPLQTGSNYSQKIVYNENTYEVNILKETENYFIKVNGQCVEGVLSCSNLKYVGVNKSTGESITLKGESVHQSKNNVPTQFLGYSFKNNDYEYFINDKELYIDKGMENIKIEKFLGTESDKKSYSVRTLERDGLDNVFTVLEGGNNSIAFFVNQELLNIFNFDEKFFTYEDISYNIDDMFNHIEMKSFIVGDFYVVDIFYESYAAYVESHNHMIIYDLRNAKVVKPKNLVSQDGLSIASKKANKKSLISLKEAIGENRQQQLISKSKMDPKWYDLQLEIYKSCDLNYEDRYFALHPAGLSYQVGNCASRAERGFDEFYYMNDIIMFSDIEEYLTDYGKEFYDTFQKATK